MTLLIAILMIEGQSLPRVWHVIAIITWFFHAGFHSIERMEKQVAFLHRMAAEAAKHRGFKV